MSQQQVEDLIAAFTPATLSAIKSALEALGCVTSQRVEGGTNIFTVVAPYGQTYEMTWPGAPIPTVPPPVSPPTVTLLPTVDFVTPELDIGPSAILRYVGPTVDDLEIKAGTVQAPHLVYVFVPAGSAAKTISWPEVWNVQGPAASPTLDTLICVEAVLIGTSIKLQGSVTQSKPSSSAPTLVSAVALGDKLKLTFSTTVKATGASGIALNYSVGTPRTVTSLLSGSGTSELIFQLSGTTLLTDAANVTLTTPPIQSVFGVQVAAATTAVAFVTSIPKTNLAMLWSAPLQAFEGVPLSTRVTDFSGNARHGTNSGAVHVKGRFRFGDASERITSTLAHTGITAYTVGTKLFKPGPNSNGSRSFIGSTTGGGTVAMFVNANGYITMRQNNGSTDYVSTYDTDSWVAEEPHVVVSTFSDGTWNLYVDDMATPVFTQAGMNNPGNGNWQLGNFSTGSGTAYSGEITAAAWYTSALDSSNRQQLAAGL